MVKKLLTAAALVLFAIAGYWFGRELAREHTSAVEVQSFAPATISFTLPDLSGTPRSFDEWHGKARIVNFWATWCAPCRREIPLLKKVQSEHGPTGLQVIGIAVDFVEDVVSYAEQADFNYPVMVGQEDAMAVAEASGVEFIGLPFTMIVAPSGELLAVHLGEIHAPQIATIVEQLARLGAGAASIEETRTALRHL